jgi:hypothetical protein
MTVNIESTFEFNREQFFGGDRVGFTEKGEFIVSAFTTPPPSPRGTYFTVIPISPTAYRLKNKRTCKNAVVDGGTHIVIKDDWGTPYTLTAPRDALTLIMAEAKLHKIPVTT